MRNELRCIHKDRFSFHWGGSYSQCFLDALASLELVLTLTDTRDQKYNPTPRIGLSVGLSVTNLPHHWYMHQGQGSWIKKSITHLTKTTTISQPLHTLAWITGRFQNEISGEISGAQTLLKPVTGPGCLSLEQWDNHGLQKLATSSRLQSGPFRPAQ